MECASEGEAVAPRSGLTEEGAGAANGAAACGLALRPRRCGRSPGRGDRSPPRRAARRAALRAPPPAHSSPPAPPEPGGRYAALGKRLLVYGGYAKSEVQVRGQRAGGGAPPSPCLLSPGAASRHRAQGAPRAAPSRRAAPRPP
jgi:hypothetical protein